MTAAEIKQWMLEEDKKAIEDWKRETQWQAPGIEMQVAFIEYRRVTDFIAIMTVVEYLIEQEQRNDQRIS